jgi:hypothetical protein
MADLTAEQAIEKLRNLPEDKQKAVLMKLSPDQRKGILDQLRTPQTAGQKYWAARRAGQLPIAEAQSFRTNPAAAFMQEAEEAGQLAQEYQYKEAGIRGGIPKFTGEGPNRRLSYDVKTPGMLQRGVSDLMSGIYGSAQVGAKIAASFSDPKMLAAFIVSKLGPYGALAAAQYFGYQSTQGLAGAIKTGKITPENLQNGLLAGAGIVGAGALAAEAPTVKSPLTPAGVKAGLQRVGRQVTGPETSFREAVTREAEAYQKAVPENQAKLEETIKENKEKIRTSRFREGEEKFALQKQNKEIEAENLRKQQEAEASAKERTEKMTQVEQQSTQAREQIEKVENLVWQEANRKFDAVKAQVGADQPGEPTESAAPLLEAVNIAQNNVLRGIPESIPLFRNILKLDEQAEGTAALRDQAAQGFGYRDYASVPNEVPTGSPPGSRTPRALVDERVATYGGDVTAGGSVGWGKLQRMKTAADTAIRARSTAPIIKEALSNVRDTVVDMMGRIAESKGATAAWEDARKFYSEWRDDFHKTSGPQGSASPIAQTLQAVDPKNIRQSLMRTQGVSENRAVNTLRKYAQFGGNETADLVQQMIQSQQSIGKAPGPVKLGTPKPVPEGSSAKPTLKTLPEKVPQPVVDATEVARKALEQRAKNWGQFNARDLGILASSVLIGPIMKMLGIGQLSEGASNVLPWAAMSYEGGKYVGSRVLRNPQVMKWLEKTPPEEIRALSNIPGADKVKIINGITDSAVETMKQMDFSTDNTAFERAKQELGKELGREPTLSEVSKRAAKLNSDEINARQQRFNAAQNNGKVVNISPEARAFLGPENVARIMAAAGAGRKEPTNPVKTPAQARQRLSQPLQ